MYIYVSVCLSSCYSPSFNLLEIRVELKTDSIKIWTLWRSSICLDFLLHVQKKNIYYWDTKERAIESCYTWPFCQQAHLRTGKLMVQIVSCQNIDHIHLTSPHRSNTRLANSVVVDHRSSKDEYIEKIHHGQPSQWRLSCIAASSRGPKKFKNKTSHFHMEHINYSGTCVMYFTL